MACYYSQQIIPATPVTTFHLKVLHWMFRPGLQLASQMRLQQAFTDIAIHRTSRGLTTIRHGRWHISQPQSLWIYQLNPNSLFWVPDVCRNHHINIPKRCFPPPPFCCTSPRQYPGKYLGLSFKTVKTWPTKNVGAADIVLQANLTKIFLIYIDVQLTSERCEYDTMYIPMRIFLWGKKKKLNTTATHHHLKIPTLKQVAGSKKSNSSPATYLSHSPKNSRSLLFAGCLFLWTAHCKFRLS